MARHRRDNVRRDVASVEHVGALVGDLPQGTREGRVLEDRADGLRLAVLAIEVGASDRIVLEVLVLG